MKQIVCLLLIFLSTNIYSQELHVKSFVEKSNDISARHYARQDNNDTPCALIKVQLAAPNALFEGAVMGAVEYKTSEYWVYMPKGSKRLTVKLEGYLPLLVEFNPLESNTTYILTITGVLVNGQQQETRTKTGWIIIDSSPQGAAVYINNEFVGNTPLDSYKQPYGTYEYRVEKPNYHSTSGTLDLNSAQYEKTITLKPAYGSIAITGGIKDATVLLDGKNTGQQTPCTLTEVPSGTHVLTIQKNKYAPRQFDVTVEDGMEAKVTASLDARFASITIKSLQGAEILIDNAVKGTTSCTLDLMEGYYDVVVNLAHHRKATKQIQVVAGQAQTIELMPTPIYGSLDVVSTPRNATITIDGKQVGQTPNTIDQLLEGVHNVTLSLNGYGMVTKNITISEGQTATISETLQSGRPITIACKDAGAHIYVDGINKGESPYNGSLAYGEHKVYAMLNGKKTNEQTISITEGNGSLSSVTLSFNSQTIIVKGITFTMISIEGSIFTMGATSEQGRDAEDDEKPTHQIKLNNYYIGETEVTQALWEAVIGNNPSRFKGDNVPVENVSWNECQAFIAKLNALTGKKFRLPTEAEWEYAARGGNKSNGYKYSGSNNVDVVAWLSDNGSDTTHPVKIKQPNELGIYDMSGNVNEWCQDWYNSSYYSISPSNKPKGPKSGSYRVCRGGSWINDAGYCRVSDRSFFNPDFHDYNLGFRLVLSD